MIELLDTCDSAYSVLVKHSIFTFTQRITNNYAKSLAIFKVISMDERFSPCSYLPMISRDASICLAKSPTMKENDFIPEEVVKYTQLFTQNRTQSLGCPLRHKIILTKLNHSTSTNSSNSIPPNVPLLISNNTAGFFPFSLFK